ncbi:hypothetical protein ANCDUO_10717 [Ancylostoma duodenale]|uniref:G-protein coupled receptors family 1 profile domain-containing protein n=1 Tax=Ancylostoma duodenale TaxID=51022 RepID=A0A0C2GQ03_9BILA|nr:hypothetical protein ANCDUO_10717 [Ancylostoma duodenale]
MIPIVHTIQQRRQGLRIDNVFRTYFGFMVLPLAFVGAILVSLFIVTVYQAIKARRVSRKCYILLLNRAIGDLVSCLVALLVCGYVLFWHEINRDMVILMESFFMGSFWSAMVSYVALSVLKYTQRTLKIPDLSKILAELFAVWRPFHYRKWFTMKRCINLIVFSWVVFILMISYTLGVSALVKIPALNEWSGCKMETCARAMYRSRNVVTIFVYFFTLVVFVITVLLIRRAQRFVDSFKKRDSSTSEGGRRVRFPLWKLALNVATFAGFYLFYVIWCIGMLLNKDQCFFQRNYPEMMRILAFVRCTLLLRIVVDPILSFITDFQVRRGFLILLGINSKLTFASSRIFQKSTYSDGSAVENGIERNSRSHTVSTISCPTTMKF